MIRILGIDPGLASLGWGVLAVNESSFEKHTPDISHLAHGLISTKSDMRLEQRLLQIEEAIEAVFLRYEINVLAYEEQFFVKNVTSGLQVAHALGVILLYAAKQGVKVHSYTPREIKLQITGNASAKKDTMQRFVSMQLGLNEMKVHHSADAVGAALCYCYKRRSFVA